MDKLKPKLKPKLRPKLQKYLSIILYCNSHLYENTNACYLSADKTSLKCVESVDLGSISPTNSILEFRSAGAKQPGKNKARKQKSDQILKPEMLRTLPDLSSFWAEQTGLRSLPKELFRSNDKLDHLVFSQNRIRQLPEKLLPKNASRLTEIRFDNNQLTSVPGDLLSTAENLVTVHLENNFLRTLPDKFFARSRKLREVYLHHNLLQWVLKFWSGAEIWPFLRFLE